MRFSSLFFSTDGVMSGFTFGILTDGFFLVLDLPSRNRSALMEIVLLVEDMNEVMRAQWMPGPARKQNTNEDDGDYTRGRKRIVAIELVIREKKNAENGLVVGESRWRRKLCWFIFLIQSENGAFH